MSHVDIQKIIDVWQRFAVTADPKTAAKHVSATAEDTLDVLLRKLCSRRSELSGYAMHCLVRFGPTAIEPLVRLITHGDSDVKDKAAAVLWIMNDVRVMPYLVPLLHDEDAAVAADAIFIIRSLGDRDGNNLARKILAQPNLAAKERFELLNLLQQIVPRDWNTKLRFPFGSLHLFCKQMAREEDEAVQAGAKAILDYLTLPRASQRHLRMSPAEMLRAAVGGSTREAK